MKRFTQLMSLLFMAAVTQYSCINDAVCTFVNNGARGKPE